MIEETLIARIKDSIAIEDVIGARVKLRRAGRRRMRAVCPFHADKDPSLVVDLDKKLWHCHGCGAGGDMVKFVADFDRLPFREVVSHLGAIAGVTVEDFDDKGDDTDRKISAGFIALRQQQRKLTEAAQDWGFRAGTVVGRGYGVIVGQGENANTLSDARGLMLRGWRSGMGLGSQDDPIVLPGPSYEVSGGNYEIFGNRVALSSRHLVDEAYGESWTARGWDEFESGYEYGFIHAQREDRRREVLVAMAKEES